MRECRSQNALRCAEGLSMDSQVLSIPARINRGLLAAVFVIASLLPGVPCCCASASCCESMDATSCAAVESNQQCCCCQESGATAGSEIACTCSKASVNSGAGFSGTCCCVERPAPNSVLVANHRDVQKRDRNHGLVDFTPVADPPVLLALDDIQSGFQRQRDPYTHNLRQAILCVWRN